jgi:tetratricopeptide (TPR) repeat protein
MINKRIPMGPDLLRRLRLASVLTVMTPLALGACSGLFEVDNPTDILEEDLEDPAVATALANSAEAAVADVYDIVVQYGELPGDAVVHASTNQGNLALDRGILGEVNERAEALYNALAAARWTATEVTRRLEALVEDPSSNAAVARSYYWDALARITLADLIEEVPFDGGPPQPPAEVYVDAIELLQKAASTAQAAGATEYVAASYATIARAHRSLYFERDGDMSAFQQAADYARRALEAAPDFVVFSRYAIPGSGNDLYGAWLGTVQYDVMDDDYANQIDPVSGLRDPRIQHSEFTGIVSTFGDSIYTQLKYPDRSSDIRVSSWQEAALILAEYNLLQGDLAQAVMYLNRVREAAGLPAFASSDADEIREQIIYERKTEFWLELRRWQDMRYYNIIPERWAPAMQEAGVDRRLPVSLRERLTNSHYQ